MDASGAGPPLSAAAIVAVLAGGLGRRIGGAKPTRKLAGLPLISYPLRAAREAGLEAVVVAKRDTELPHLSERVVHEPDEPRHPLCGVLAALEHARASSPPRAVVLVGCDMPFLTAALLGHLAALDGAALLRVGERRQPLPARCTPEHAGALRRALDSRSSLGGALDALAPRLLGGAELSTFGQPQRLCFSVNSVGDLEQAERWLAETRSEA
ncbi:MAG: 4-diphosphocytidyl-2C-methyl-D-erythritol synthase [Solirubrobacterales bacterium]|nr:4-diphosphocytidyl-2C-methyl-D-erythritol synthase [Solirubrobacterales bacterium]